MARAAALRVTGRRGEKVRNLAFVDLGGTI